MKKGMLYTVLTAVLFVTLEPVSKLIAWEVNPYAITFWRFAIGAVILLPFAIVKIKREKLKIGLKQLGIMTGLGVLFICVSMVALQIGVAKAESPSIIAIIFSSNSVFTILFASLILKEKFTANKGIALVLGVIGVLICADFSGGTNFASVALGVLAAVSFSLYTILSRKFVKNLGGVVQTALVFLLGSGVLLIALLVMKAEVFPPIGPKTLAILAYIGIFVTGIGYLCYFSAIEKGGAIMGAMAFFIKPILTPFTVWVINGVKPNATALIAVVFIVAASWFAALKKEKVCKAKNFNG